jgi:predicted site-specific integrase-resolvase
LKQNNLLEKKKICYARVSSYDRKEDLARQIAYLTEKYPDYEIIKEITKDLIEIITVYSSKIHGTRSYKNIEKKD